jgi:hypothetical protein
VPWAATNLPTRSNRPADDHAAADQDPLRLRSFSTYV